jgi:dihydroorotate dehydrogenase electron transfer subunit
MHVLDKTVGEARDIRSFWFSGDLRARPGQFVMLWLPGVGLKPFGVSYQEKGSFALTIRKVGPFTEKLFRCRPGDYLGMQGPHGRPFSGEGEKAALVGGGYGTSPLGFLAEELAGMGKRVFLVTGAATKDLVLFRRRFGPGSGVEMLISTDDGSLGRKGFCTDCLPDLFENEGIDRVYCCGPERMMKKVFDVCLEKGIPAEFSLERYMKCGFGLCGSCCLDGTGWTVCRDGPVFTLEQLKKVTEFGSYKRDATGKRTAI